MASGASWQLTNRAVSVLGCLGLLACNSPAPITVTSAPSGNGAIVGKSDGVVHIDLERDPGTNLWQWYSFLILGGRGENVTWRLDALQASFAPESWVHHAPVMSLDHGSTWHHLKPPRLQDSSSLEFGPELLRSDTVWMAYAPVYSGVELDDLAATARSDGLQVNQIGRTPQGRPVVAIRNHVAKENARRIWIVAREHPAEVAGSWVADGLIRWLGSGNSGAEDFRDRAVLNVVVVANPDGVESGYYRTNAHGQDLSHSWFFPDSLATPETLAIERAMLADIGRPAVRPIVIGLHAHSSIEANFGLFRSTGADTAYNGEMNVLSRAIGRRIPLDDRFTTRTGGKGVSTLSESAANRLGALAMVIEFTYDRLPERGFVGVSDYRMYGEGLGQALLEFICSVPNEAPCVAR